MLIKQIIHQLSAPAADELARSSGLTTLTIPRLTLLQQLRTAASTAGCRPAGLLGPT